MQPVENGFNVEVVVALCSASHPADILEAIKRTPLHLEVGDGDSLDGVPSSAVADGDRAALAGDSRAAVAANAGKAGAGEAWN
jgi:hypothetical protein